MINAKMIARIMGALFFIEAGFLILCSFLAVYYNESDISAFLYSAAITAGAGSIAALAGKNAEKRISRRDGYVIVTLAWVFFSLFGMLPFYLSGYIPTITDAFFVNHVRIHHHRSKYFGQYRVIATRAFVLAKYDTMDRRIRNCLFYYCRITDFRSRQCTIICSGSHRSHP